MLTKREAELPVCKQLFGSSLLFTLLFTYVAGKHLFDFASILFLVSLSMGEVLPSFELERKKIGDSCQAFKILKLWLVSLFL